MEQLVLRQQELQAIIKAFDALEKSREWQIVKEKVYRPSLQSIERQMLLASREKEIDLNKIYHLQGELAWASKYTDTDKYIEYLKKELENINSKLK